MTPTVILSKSCTKCGEIKQLYEFSAQKYNKDGRRGDCKACANAAAAAYRAANLDKVRVAQATYRAANLGKVKAAAAAWQRANPDKINANTAAWAAAHPEAARLRNQNRYARKRNSGGKLSKGLSDKLFTLQRGLCACCGMPLGKKYHLDHIMPIALGGPNIDSNIQLLRQRCNNQKHAKHPIDFMQSRGYLL